MIIYSITFGSAASSSIAEQVMQNCASPGDYYHAPTNAALDAIFQQIAGELSDLRLTQQVGRDAWLTRDRRLPADGTRRCKLD